MSVPSFKEAYVGYHYVIAAAATGAYVVVDVVDSGNTLVGALAPGDRSALYITLATTTGALLGFAITAVTILLTLGSGDRIEFLRRREEYPYVRVVLMGAIHALGLATVVFTVLIVADTAPKHPRVGWEYAGVFALWLAIARLTAVIDLLNKLLKLILADQARPDPATSS